MKTRPHLLLTAVVLFLFPFILKSQSTIEFQPGTGIEVTTGADICADNVIINGTYSGDGTQCENALPVELVSFTAHSKGNIVTLLWKTATEINSYGFEIERQLAHKETPASSWIAVGFVEGNGMTAAPNEYSFKNELTRPGIYAYRIKQIDNNGSFTYTPSVEVVVGTAPKKFSLSQNFPNPFNPTTTIEFTLQEEGNVTLQIFDIAGREMATLVNEAKKAEMYHQVKFDASRFPTGTYFYRLESNGKQLVRKFLLVK